MGVGGDEWGWEHGLVKPITRRLQPAHLVSCIIRGGTANINFFITTALSDEN